jgi:hypothetical protein
VNVKSTKTRLLLTLGAVVVVATIGVGATSLALFTSTTSVAANTFSTGTVIIGTSPATALVTLATMAPGDSVTSPLTVSNTGTLDLRYAVASVATNTDLKGLKDQLVLTIKTGVTDCTSPAGFAADGTSICTGDLDSTAGLIIGNSTTGQQAGDRTLAAGTNEVLCFNVLLPTSTDNTFQGSATTATFTFNAEQTKNN